MSQILIIEDSLYQRAKTKHLLEAAGHQVLQAANGREGLLMAASGQPACILLDLIMPEMGGIEVLEELRRHGAHIPVIVVSADIQESTQRQCLELGAVAFVNKPPQPHELETAVTAALATSAALDAAARSARGTA
jgi:CheY-like chemotaxis protein